MHRDQSAVNSNHSGCVSAWSAISVRIEEMDRLGFQSHCSLTRVLSRTIHGISNRLSSGSAVTWRGPKRSVHQLLSSNSDIELSMPPATLHIRCDSESGF